jgi:hypothetical protein
MALEWACHIAKCVRVPHFVHAAYQRNRAPEASRTTPLSAY